MTVARTPARKKARELAKHLRGERPDYDYLKQVFRICAPSSGSR
jgi:integrase/recombinase XerD